MMKVNKTGIDLGVLMATGLYDYRDDVDMVLVGNDYEVKYNVNGEAISSAIEAHVELGGDYSSVMGWYIDNMRKDMTNAIEWLLDSKAQEFRYDDMKSVRSYTGFDNPFRAECITLATWGASCWIAAGQIEADVASGNRAMPTITELMAEMPQLGN